MKKERRRQWWKAYHALSQRRWGGLPWTLPDEYWTETELNKRNDEIDRWLKVLPPNSTY